MPGDGLCHHALNGCPKPLLTQHACLCTLQPPQGVFEHLAEKGQQAPAPVGLQIMVHGTVPTGAPCCASPLVACSRAEMLHATAEANPDVLVDVSILASSIPPAP